MNVNKLGEFGLIKKLTEIVEETLDSDTDASSNLIIGIGDDTAAWLGTSATQLATVDAFVEGVHFSPKWMSWEDIGWKALAVNLSDIAAMGGTPTYALVSLSLPPETDVKNIEQMYRGMAVIAGKYGVVIAGGNVSRAPVVTLSITVFGQSRGHLLFRSSAQEGDVIALTGNAGTAAGGLQILSGTAKCTGPCDCLKNCFRRPKPRLPEAQVLVEEGVNTAIDVSDGIIADMEHICEASGMGARLQIDTIPLHSETVACFGEKALELALTGGEDYELLFTASEATVEKVKQRLNCTVTVIGEIIAGRDTKVSLFGADGKPYKLKKSGWDHFRH